MRTQAATRTSVTWWLCLIAVAAVLLSGCETATGYIGTLLELDQAGISNPSISNSGDQVILAYDSTVSQSELVEEENRAAEVIWRHLPLRFSTLEIDPRRDLGVPRVYSREELEGRFGLRPARLDKGQGDIERDLRNTWRNVLRALVVAVVALLVLVALVIVLVVRAVRKRPPAAPPAGWAAATAGGPQPPWPQQPPGYPPAQPGQGWGAQAPAGQPSAPPQTPWQPGTGQPAWQPPPAPSPAPAQPVWQPQQPPPASPPTHEETGRLDQSDETRQLDQGDQTRRIPRDPPEEAPPPSGPDDETRPLGDQERGPTPPP
jgi:hypothetical protein